MNKPLSARSLKFRPFRLNVLLCLVLGLIAAAHVIDLGFDKDFRGTLIKVFVDALSLS